MGEHNSYATEEISTLCDGGKKGNYADLLLEATTILYILKLL